MGDISAFVAFDTSKLRKTRCRLRKAGRLGEVRFFGEIDNTGDATAKLVKKLAAGGSMTRASRVPIPCERIDTGLPMTVTTTVTPDIPGGTTPRT